MSPGAAGDDRPAPPGRVCRLALAAVVQVLPRGDVRDRYRQEFLAELHELDGRRRARHLAGLAPGTVRISGIVRRAARLHWEELVGPRPKRPLLCLLNLRHRWHQASTEDGERFTVCSRCGKDFPVRDGRTRNSDGGYSYTGF